MVALPTQSLSLLPGRAGSAPPGMIWRLSAGVAADCAAALKQASRLPASGKALQPSSSASGAPCAWASVATTHNNTETAVGFNMPTV